MAGHTLLKWLLAVKVQQAEVKQQLMRLLYEWCLIIISLCHLERTVDCIPNIGLR